MGYDLHITRRDEWFDEKEESISLGEWKEYVESDPEMRMDNFAETTVDEGKTLRVEADGMSVWIKYSQHGTNGNMAWFSYHGGNISVKNPDAEIIGKMLSIANSLSARVQGDEGEFHPLEETSTSMEATPNLPASGGSLSPLSIALIIIIVLGVIGWKWLIIR